MDLKVNAIIEIAGTPKEHVIEVMDKAISLIKESKSFKLLGSRKSEPKNIPQSEKIFSAFAEVELSFPSFEALSGFCFDFMPSSVEIVEPEKISMETIEISNTLNDLLAKLHQYDMVLKKYIMQERIAKDPKKKK